MPGSSVGTAAGNIVSPITSRARLLALLAPGSAVLSGPEESFAGGKVQRNGENTKHEAKQQGRHEKAGSEVEIAGK